MYPLITASFITAVVALLDIRGKCVKPIYKYVAIFLVIAGINYFFQGMKAEAIDLSNSKLFDRPSFVRMKGGITLKVVNPQNDYQKDFILKCKKLMDYHYEEGCKSLKEVEEASILIPESPAYDKAAFCLSGAIATLAPGDPTLRLIGAAISICGSYGLMVMSEWQRLDTKLHQAKHHFEMEEHYRMMGKYVQAQYYAEKENRE